MMQYMEYATEQAKDLVLMAKAHAPGRINLIGEHTDYNGGKVLPFAMQKGVFFELWGSREVGPFEESCFTLSSHQQTGVVRVQARELLELRRYLRFGDGGQDIRPFLPEAIARSWGRYALGCLLWHLVRLAETAPATHYPKQMVIRVKADLPVGAGISSSAALCVGYLSLMDRFAALGTDLQVLAQEAMYVEHQFAGTHCGLMDQTAVALCEAHKLLMIDFKDLSQDGRVATRSVALHEQFADYRPVLVNTKVKHELGSSPYNERRRSCEVGLAKLVALTGLAYPSLGYFASDAAFLKTFAPDGTQKTLTAELSSRVFAGDSCKAQRVAHAIMETRRVDEAAAALEKGDREALQTLINASHESLRDDYEVSCRELDLIREQALDLAARIGRELGLTAPPILGARMTGGGFGGSTIQLVHQAILENFGQRMIAPDSVYVRETGLIPELILADFAQGTWVEIL